MTVFIALDAQVQHFFVPSDAREFLKLKLK
jgi:hypothetical protein